jgi:hypothetical protein
MPIVPEKAADKITWFEAHHAPFTANATAIGTTTAEVSALAALVTAARARQVAQIAAQEAARTATNEYNNAVAAMALAGSDILIKVKARAATGGHAIYDLAQIPPPATPSPVGPPGMPTAFRVALKPDGALELSWKCANPRGSAGTIYQVLRKIGAGEFSVIGGSGTRKFVDGTVPAGVASVVYRVQAIRSTQVGTANDVTVNFGVSGGGQATASAAPQPKLAA